MNKNKVLIIRGSSLNSWEMQNYAPLAEDYDLMALSGTNFRYDVGMIGFPVMQVQTLADVKKKLGPLQKLPGASRLGERFIKLEPVLAGADIVHSAESFNIYSHQAALLKNKLGFKLILTVWENIPFLWDGVGSESSRVRKRKQETIRLTDHFIAITERAKATLLLEGVKEEKITVLPMGIDTQRFSPKMKDEEWLDRFNLSKDDNVVLTIANLHWHKGVQDLVFAAAKLKMDGLVDKHNLKFLVIGKGEDQKKIYRLIDKAGVADVFRTVREVSYEDMPSIHNLADIFFLGSWPSETWQEQLGMVLIESMASSKSVIAAESGSISEVVGDAGVLVPPADYYRLNEEIVKLIREEKKLGDLGQKARKRAKSKFNSQEVSQQIGKIYKQVLNS